MIYNALLEWLVALAPNADVPILQFYAVGMTLAVCFIPVYFVMRWFKK